MELSAERSVTYALSKELKIPCSLLHYTPAPLCYASVLAIAAAGRIMISGFLIVRLAFFFEDDI